MADVVFAYAENCDQLSKLEAAVAMMVHKHVSFDVVPKHYDYMGESLLEGMKQVLGDAATKEIMDAWAEGYQFLADLLIEEEKKMKKANAEMIGIQSDIFSRIPAMS